LRTGWKQQGLDEEEQGRRWPGDARERWRGWGRGLRWSAVRLRYGAAAALESGAKEERMVRESGDEVYSVVEIEFDSGILERELIFIFVPFS
jgi:hypothetical protein